MATVAQLRQLGLGYRVSVASNATVASLLDLDRKGLPYWVEAASGASAASRAALEARGLAYFVPVTDPVSAATKASLNAQGLSYAVKAADNISAASRASLESQGVPYFVEVDSSGNSVSGGVSAPVITSSLTASGTVGVAFSYTITATNSPTSYNATGLPAGLSVNTGTGAITGTPSAAATTNITISATNAGGTGSATLVLTVSAAGTAPVLSGASSIFSDTFAWLRVTTDTGSGTLYAVVVPAAATPPTGAQIEAGQDGSGAAATAAANQAISASGAKDLLLRSIAAATAYKIYATHKVGSNYSNIVNVAFTSDTLVVAAVTDGTTTGITVSAGSTFTNTQSDPFGGTNAVKWADNGDASTAIISLNVGTTFFNGVNKVAALVKYQSGSAWERVATLNLTPAINGTTHWNTSTGAAGVNAAPWTNVVILSLGSGWYMWTGRFDGTGQPDLVGALQMFKAATDNSSAPGIHDGTHIQFLHNIRITR